jgi:hypothetical protein
MTELVHEEGEQGPESRSPGYWDNLSEKGRRDAEISEKLDQLRHEARSQLFENGITEEVFESEFLTDLKSNFTEILSPYELSENDTRQRISEVLEEQRELFEYVRMDAFGEVAFNSYQAYKIFDGLRSSICECEFKVREEGIEIRFMDPQRIQLAKILFTSSTFRFFQEGTVDVNLDDLAMVLKATKSEKAITTIIFTKRELKITKRSTELSIPIKDTLAALDLEFEEIPMENLLTLEYPFSFELQKQQFEYILKHTDIHSEILVITATPTRLEFSQSGQIGRRSIPLEKEDLEDLSFDPSLMSTDADEGEVATAGFSLAFLKSISKMIYLMNNEDTLSFCMRTDHPLLTEISIPLRYIGKGVVGELSIRNFIACRDISEKIDVSDGDMEDF